MRIQLVLLNFLLISNTVFADTNVIDGLLERLAKSNDSRISTDINGYYVLKGVNPDDYSECSISLKRFNIRATSEFGYTLGVRDLNPNTKRVINPVVDIDILYIRAYSSGGGKSKVVRSNENSIKLRTAAVIPFWAGPFSSVKLSYAGDSIEASASFSGGPFSRSDKYYKFKTEEEFRNFFASGRYNNYDIVRPHDSISCNFEF